LPLTLQLIRLCLTTSRRKFWTSFVLALYRAIEERRNHTGMFCVIMVLSVKR
jgi:hypothetical protein